MKIAKIYVDSIYAGDLKEVVPQKKYTFEYIENYNGLSVCLDMPLSKKFYEFDQFPSFFEGLLPEGIMLESLLRQSKLDRNDLLGQLIAVGGDMVGNITVEKAM